jgi:hypothetical protein
MAQDGHRPTGRDQRGNHVRLVEDDDVDRVARPVPMG